MEQLDAASRRAHAGHVHLRVPYVFPGSCSRGFHVGFRLSSFPCGRQREEEEEDDLNFNKDSVAALAMLRIAQYFW